MAGGIHVIRYKHHIWNAYGYRRTKRDAMRLVRWIVKRGEYKHTLIKSHKWIQEGRWHKSYMVYTR